MHWLLGSYFGLGSSGCWQVLRIASTFISARSPTRFVGFGIPLREAHAAILCHINPAEKIHVGNEVTRSESPLAQLNQKSVVTVLVVVVAMLLIAGRPVFRVRQFCA